MTPFTLQMHQILSDAAGFTSPLGQNSSCKNNQLPRNPITDSRASNKSNGGDQNNIFDFPDLPDINNANTSSPSSATVAALAAAIGSEGTISGIVDFSAFTDSNHSHDGNNGNHGTLSNLMMMDDMDFQELLSTDVIMPSSPPTANGANHSTNGTTFFNWFDNQDTHGNDDGSNNNNNNLWDEISNDHATDETGRRISPRKNKGQRKI